MLLFDANNCVAEPLYTYVLATCLCIAGLVSYLPQYYSLIKSGQATGISESSLLLLNIGAACLAANSFILNFWKFNCYHQCSVLLCTGNLLPMFQIMIGWITVLPLYVIFLRFKIRESQNRIIYDIMYGIIYGLFIFIMVIVGITEENLSSDSRMFFNVSAQILGILAAIASAFVWIPQIYHLLKTKEQGSLSLLMFILQTPGNIMIVIAQVLYRQSWTTWITYVVIFIEQVTIVVILLVLRYKQRKTHQLNNVVDDTPAEECESLIASTESL